MFFKNASEAGGRSSFLELQLRTNQQILVLIDDWFKLLPTLEHVSQVVSKLKLLTPDFRIFFPEFFFGTDFVHKND